MGKTTYKAAIFRDVGKVELVEKPYPECGDDDIIVKNLIAGVCGSDVGAYANGGDTYMIWKDHEFGHEMVSEIVEMGKNVKGLSIGDYVFPNMGNAHRDRMRMATVGGFSEYIYVPQCELDYSVLMIDKDIPITTAVLLEPFVIGTRGILNLNPSPGKTAIIFGAGIIGMAAAVMAKWYGCDKVMVVDISEKRLANAASFGLVTCNPQSEDLKAKAFEEFGSQQGFGGETCNADLYIDAIGSQVAIDNFAMLAGREASLGVVGSHHAPSTINLLPLCYGNWHIHGCGNVSINDAFKDIQEMMKSGKFDLSVLVSHTFSLDQIEDALRMGGNSKEAQKVVISYM